MKVINNEVIKLFQKTISSLACVEKTSSDEELINEANIYILDLVVEYSKYLEKGSVDIINFEHTEEDIIDFSYRCIENKVDDLVRFGEDVQFGIIELTKLIKTEKNKEEKRNKMKENKDKYLDEMDEGEQILYFFNSLMTIYEECIKEDKYKGNIKKFEYLLSILKKIRTIYLENTNLVSVEESIMNDFFKVNYELFDIYNIDELDFNTSSIKAIYTKSVKRGYVEYLRRINREKRKSHE